MHNAQGAYMPIKYALLKQCAFDHAPRQGRRHGGGSKGDERSPWFSEEGKIRRLVGTLMCI